MQAEPSAQARLLELQAVDTAIDQFNHRARTLPELALIQVLATERGALGERLVAAQTLLSDVETVLAKAEADLEPVKERLARNQARVDSGSVRDPKALSAMVDEIAHLKHRVIVLEDAQLDAMEAVEQAAAARAAVAAERAELDVNLKALLARRDTALVDLKADLDDRRAVRAGVLEEVPGPLLDLYEKIRMKNHGVGAAPLVGNSCSGCGLEATATDLERYLAAAPSEVLRCEECQRILVRKEA